MILSIMMHSIKCTHTSTKSPNSLNSIGLLSSLSGSKPSWCSSYWKWSPLAPKSVWPHCWLACSSWWPPPCHFSSSREIRCGGLLVHLVGVGVRELACLLFVFLFLLCSSPILHLALIGLVTFLVAHVANHGLSFIKLLHSLDGFDGVILMKLGLLCLAFHLSQVLGKTSYFLLELLILHCNILCACIYNNFLNTNLVAQG